MARELGTSTDPNDMHGQFVQFDPRSSDPASPVNGEMWIRDDITSPSIGKVGELRVRHADETVPLSIFEPSALHEGELGVLRCQVNGSVGTVPLLDVGEGTLDVIRFQHNNSVYEFGRPKSEADHKLIHRWYLNDVNGTVDDVIGNANGTNNGVSSVAGDWVRGAAGDGDGESYIDPGTLGNFGSNMASDFAVAVTIQTDVETGQYAIGVNNDNDSTSFWGCFMDSDGNLGGRLGDQDNNRLTVETNSGTFADNNIYRIVLNKTGNDASDLDIWTNQSEESVVIVHDEDFTNPTDFDQSCLLFALNALSISQEWRGVIDDICLFNDSLTQQEIQSYRNPWD